MQNIVKKIGILGDSGVGKRTLFKKTFYTCTDVDAGLKAIGASVGKEKFKIKYDGDDAILTLLAWDMTGHEKFDSFRPAYCEGVQGVVIVSRSDNEDSMFTMGKYVDLVHQMAGYKIAGNVPISFVVNKVAGHWKEPDSRQRIQSLMRPEHYNAGLYCMNFKRCKGETLKQPFKELGMRILEGYDVSLWDDPD